MTDHHQQHYDLPDSKPYPGNEMLSEASKYVESVGLANAITKIYITTEPLPGLPLLLFLFVLSTVQNMTWSAQHSTMVCVDKKIPLDGTCIECVCVLTCTSICIPLHFAFCILHVMIQRFITFISFLHFR
jgi:hypothetical protein